ncbi:MAG: CPBP family intramembrane glutamic endopeptidase [Thermoanaerobaculia bacterium]|nr:CPBP family intramembrane glutamic endopeptidase [Thermoanaerobaculia bacterium]
MIESSPHPRSSPDPAAARAASTILLLAAVVLVLAEYGLIPLRFPALFPDLVERYAPGVWYGTAELARQHGAAGVWWGPLLPFAWWSLGLAVLWIAVPMLWAARLGFSPGDLGWRLGRLRSKAALYVLLYLPVGLAVVWAARRPSFLATYPMLRPEQILDWSWTLLGLYWLLYAVQFVAVEFFFRGYLLFGLERHFGRAAIAVMVVPYTMIHFHKPLPEVFGAIVAGLVLGWLALETRSLWGGVLLHVSVALSMDLAALTLGPFSLPRQLLP